MYNRITALHRLFVSDVPQTLETRNPFGTLRESVIQATKPLIEQAKEQTKGFACGIPRAANERWRNDWRTMGVPPYILETSICCRVSDD